MCDPERKQGSRGQGESLYYHDRLANRNHTAVSGEATHSKAAVEVALVTE